jgi:hypothetical protein
VPQDFFHESVSPKPLSILLGPFQIVQKFATGIVDKFAKVAGRAYVFSNLQIFGLNPQLQFRKFLRYASPQISNLQILLVNQSANFPP